MTLPFRVVAEHQLHRLGAAAIHIHPLLAEDLRRHLVALAANRNLVVLPQRLHAAQVARGIALGLDLVEAGGDALGGGGVLVLVQQRGTVQARALPVLRSHGHVVLLGHVLGLGFLLRLGGSSGGFLRLALFLRVAAGGQCQGAGGEQDQSFHGVSRKHPAGFRREDITVSPSAVTRDRSSAYWNGHTGESGRSGHPFPARRA